MGWLVWCQLWFLAAPCGSELAGPSEEKSPVSHEEDIVSLLQTSSHAELRSGLRTKIHHDDDVNECDGNRPTPPTVGIWTTSSTPSRFGRGLDAKVIVDIGGSVGYDLQRFRWTHPDAKIFTFEPVPTIFEKLKASFAKDLNLLVHNFGVSNATGQTQLILEDVDGIGSTGEDHNAAGKHVQVQLRDIDEVLAKIENATGRAPDIFSMNCEGCEYAVMQRMAERGWLSKIPNVQLSWHLVPDVKDRVAKRCEIESLLWKTHARAWRSRYGWVGWKAAK